MLEIVWLYPDRNQSQERPSKGGAEIKSKICLGRQLGTDSSLAQETPEINLKHMKSFLCWVTSKCTGVKELSFKPSATKHDLSGGWWVPQWARVQPTGRSKNHDEKTGAGRKSKTPPINDDDASVQEIRQAAASGRPRGATVARLTPDQKVACSNHVGVTALFSVW